MLHLIYVLITSKSEQRYILYQNVIINYHEKDAIIAIANIA